MAAQEFIYKHELNQDFLDQIANFIIKNSSGHTLGQDIPRNDPYANETSKPKLVHIPMMQYSYFKTGTIQVIVGKIIEFNQSAVDKLTDSEISALKEIGTTKVKDIHVDVVFKTCLWKEELRFPGIDLLRLIALEVDPTKYLGDSLFDWMSTLTLGQNKFQENGVLCALRLACNLFAWDQGHRCFDVVKHWISQNKNIKLAYVTYMAKYCFYSLTFSMVIHSLNSGKDTTPLLSIMIDVCYILLMLGP
jgi:phospholipase A-2-activating protein